MIGGFGAGSELIWNLLGGLGYKVFDSISAIAGLRAVSIDY
ncbi:hypothetical protein FHS85_003160 [Rhodoligotrophos appendicifer]|nr:hypothetical protein [Rhodoligotrophos appendicifer]